MGIEGAFALTPLAVVMTYFISGWFPDMPDEVKLALVGLIVTCGTIAMSRFRDRKFAGKSLLGVGLLIGLLTIGGCVSYDASGYHRLATSEIATLSQVPAQLTVERCLAHAGAAGALRDTEGDGSAFRGPLGAGRAIAPTADSHDRQSIICQKLFKLLSQGEASQSSIDRAFAAWRRQYESGDALFGEE
jgi:hypothetical protein